MPELACFAIFPERTGVVFVTAQGSASKLIALESPAVQSVWDGARRMIYIGHENGKLSSYTIKIITKQILLRSVERKKKAPERQQAQPENKHISILHNILKRKNLTVENISQLTKEDMLEIYPELKSFVPAIIRAQPTLGNEKEIAARKKKVDEIMKINSEQFSVAGMDPQLIF